MHHEADRNSVNSCQLINPNRMLSIFTIFLNLPSITLSKTFIACAAMRQQLYAPCMSHMSVHRPFTIQLLLQSSGTLPSFTTALHKVIHNVPVSSAALSISATTPVGPADLPCFIFPIATPTFKIKVKTFNFRYQILIFHSTECQ